MLFEFNGLELKELTDHEFEKHEENLNYTDEIITSEKKKLTFDSKVKPRKPI